MIADGRRRLTPLLIRLQGWVRRAQSGTWHDDWELIALTGALGLLVVAVTHEIQIIPALAARRDTLVVQWLILGTTGPIYLGTVLAGDLLRRRLPAWSVFIRPFWFAGVVGASWIATALVAPSHRRYLILIALFEVIIFSRLPRSTREHVAARGIAAITIAVTWILAAPLSFTPIADLLLSAGKPFGLTLPVAGIALAWTTIQLGSAARSSNAGRRAHGPLAIAAACVIFAELAFRSDGVLTDFALYHRGYYTAPAQLVRNGHWLLWDVPSQYGFLSILTLAWLPVRSTWQSLYLETGVILVAQSLSLLAILRYRRPGLASYVFALSVTCATLLSSAAFRPPFGARLYPQAGLRFFWITTLIAIAFATYRCFADGARRKRWRWCGHGVWIVAVLWSFEVSIWSTVTWGAFLLTEALVDGLALRRGPRGIASTVLRRLWPPALAAGIVALCVDAIYRLRLGHDPDLRGTFEFNLTYAIDTTYHTTVNLAGPGWLLLLVLAATGTCAIAATRARLYAALPVLATCWFGLWATASYYAGEAWDNHVNVLVMVIGFVAAVVIAVSRDVPASGGLTLTRLAFAPPLAILLTTSFGDTGALAQIRAPLAPGFSADATAEFPPIGGELADIMHRSGIRPTDRVVFSNGFAWTKLTSGLLLPFVRDANGRLVEYRTWLPNSPWGNANMINSLTSVRRQIYIERFLDRTHAAGWYVAYRHDADCKTLSLRLRTIRTFANANYTSSLCAYSEPSAATAKR